jgi:general secretion pathway protein D
LFFTLGSVIIFNSFYLFAQEATQESLEYSLSIEEYLKNALPPQEGRVATFNEVTGILTVTDTPSNHRLIRKLIEQFDVGPKQVMIEAKFVEIAFENLDELGIEWYWYKRGEVTAGSTPTSTTIINKSVNVNPAYEGVQWDTFPATNFGLGFVMSQFTTNKFITSYLRALASEGRANLLSSPKITTLSGQMANIQVTQTIPYASDVNFENAGTADHPVWQLKYTIAEKITGITLEVTPYVSANSNIVTLDIHPEVSNLVTRRPIFESASGTNPFTETAGVPTNLGWPVIDTRTAQTSVMIQSGETVIMGGFVKDDETLTKKKVPFLGDIPLVGSLFKYEYKSRTKKNLVIFLTATLVTPEGIAEE